MSQTVIEIWTVGLVQWTVAIAIITIALIRKRKVMNNYYKIERTEDEISDVLNRAADAEEFGTSDYPGMTYEQGIKAFAEWLFGETEDNPLED